MGAAGSLHTQEEEIFAFKVLRFDVEHGTLAAEKALSSTATERESERERDSQREAETQTQTQTHTAHAPLTDEQLHAWAEDVYTHALRERELPLLECTHPAVVAYKYSLLSAEEKQALHHDVLQLARLQDKKLHKKKACSKAADYAQSFSGTEADSKNEHEAAAILRGGEKERACEDDTFKLLTPPHMPRPAQLAALRKSACWLKFLSHSGCYLYLHPLTRDLVAVCPEGFVDEDDHASSKHASEEEKDPANGLPKVAVADLPDEIDRIVKELKKTPLIIDTSEEQIAKTFYTYKGHLEDVSVLVVPYGKSGIKKEDVMERCRKRLVGAMKSGTNFVLYLGGVTIEHADFKTKLCKKDVFPKEVFISAGLKLLEPDYDPKYKHIYREEDLEAGQKITREGFFSTVITSLDPYEYESKLADSLPLGYMYPIVLVRDNED